MELEKFKSTVLPLREKLLNIARNILENEDDAEDAVQETFLRIWNIRTQLDKHPNLNGYVTQTLKNVCIDKIRTNKVNISIDNVQIIENKLNPYQDTEQNDNINIIRKIIDTLPELQRRILLMRDVEGYELEEIAEITASDAGTVRVYLSRARKKVRDKFISINSLHIENSKL